MSKLLLVDGHSILHRAYFGMPNLTNSKGVPTGGVYGFLTILFKIMEVEKPTHLMVAFDEHAPTFRHEVFKEYKGTRKPMEDNLRVQVPMIKEMLGAMQIPVVTKPGYEADDILGTIAFKAEAEGFEVTIVSGDRDLLQLATDVIKIAIPKTKKTGTEIENYFAKDVQEKYGATPIEFIDMKALMGDSSDNIPGVPSIGEKTASAIISQYHSIEEAYAHVDELKPPKAAANLKEYWEQAKLSKWLATIEVNAPIDFDLEDAILEGLYTKEAYVLCKEWEFKNFLARFENVDASSEIKGEFYIINDFMKLDKTFEALNKYEEIGFFAQAFEGELFGVSLTGGDETYFILPENFITPYMLADKTFELLKNKKVYSIDLKASLRALFIELDEDRLEVLRKEGAKALAPQAVDVAVAAYLLDPLWKGYTSDYIASNALNMMTPSLEDILGKMTLERALKDKPEEAAKYLSYSSFVATKAWPVYKERLEQEKMLSLYEDIELPLTFTLLDMEMEGMALDAKSLTEFGETLASQITGLEKSIYEKVGFEFNINSTKQLGEVLFEKLELPCEKKTKSGYSTAAEVLEKLAADYPIVADILTYRKLAKLKSTYADGLVTAQSADGRIHSTFQQTVTATGRISSTEPNLQNIPTRDELGKEIRKVFYPKEGCVLLDADYSQIELRVLAHMSGDEKLIEAFRQGLDIHRSTASYVFDTPFDEVTDLQRRNAKAVNFGIVYGISAFGLAKDIGVSRKEAQQYIDEYFETYPKMKIFLDEKVAEAKENACVYTMLGRKRPIPEINAPNFMQRSFGERVAMNSPIQGSAADIIKIAMVRVHDRLFEEGLKSRLVLQVHDELIIEAYVEELDMVKAIMKHEMEEAVEMAVPLEIDMHSGSNWYEAK